MLRSLLLLLHDVTDFFLPNLCAACDHQLLRGEACICTSCQMRLPLTRFRNGWDNPLFRQFAGRARIEQASAFCHFTKGGRIQRLMHRLKYANRPEIGLRLGQLYGHALVQSDGFPTADLILPVPLHKHRQKVRGYNQSACIAEGLSQTLSIPVRTDLLSRSRNTASQTRKSRFDRAGNVDSAFHVVDPICLQGLHVILVDDVVTTGSTLVAVAETLLGQVPGVRVSIAALAFARA
jgi:ComF family protein